MTIDSSADADVHSLAYAVLMTCAPADKCAAVQQLISRWTRGELRLCGTQTVRTVNDPGRPQRPHLVPHAQLPRRGLGSLRGRLALAHALAHIEFNAINLAVDAVYRFRKLPTAFYADWLRVASEEAEHFSLLCRYLATHECAYGDFAAHGGLWDAACRTADDVLARMALVPRVLEARGLDVTPVLIEKLVKVGDAGLVEVLQKIYVDEIEHVRIGNYWFKRLCAERGEDARKLFRSLISTHYAGRLRGPFNAVGRSAAGFSDAEIRDLEELGESS